MRAAPASEECPYFCRRFAAFRRILRDQVTGFSSSDSAAAQIAALSASVSGILMSDVCRSSAFFGGRPLIMSINNTHKNLDFKPDYALISDVNYGYNKHVDWG
jgi:hypothetical protein